MRRFFLPLPQGVRPGTPPWPLRDFLAAKAGPELGFPLSPERAAEVIGYGSVWYGNVRVKDPDCDANRLFDPRENRERRAKRQSGHAKRPPAIPVDEEQEMRHGPWLQVFYPELSIEEYSFDPRLVAWEDEHIAVVRKPAMLNTCPSVFSDSNCLTWGIQKWLDGRPECAGYRVNTINRLDYATQGLVFYAKHKAAELALFRMIQRRQVHKRYLVATPRFDLPDAATVAARTPAGAKVRLDAPPGGGYGLRVEDDLEWKGRIQRSATLIRLIGPEAGGGRLYWMALPQTGRTHQIRKHFARYLEPIAGDPAYGGGRYGKDEQLMLACVAYRFRHPLTGARVRVQYLPDDMGVIPCLRAPV